MFVLRCRPCPSFTLPISPPKIHSKFGVKFGLEDGEGLLFRPQSWKWKMGPVPPILVSFHLGQFSISIIRGERIT